MSNTNDPAATADGTAATPTRPDLSGLPAKVRVHALAKLLERSSKEIIDALGALGGSARSAQSSVDRDLALKVADELLGPDQAGDGAPVPVARDPEPEPEADAAPAAALAPVFAAPSPVFLPPTAPAAAPVRAASKAEPKPAERDDVPEPVADQTTEQDPESIDADGADGDDDSDAGRRRRRRGRRGRGRGKGGQDEATDEQSEDGDEEPVEQSEQAGDEAVDDSDSAEDGEGGGNRRRRRRRRRKGTGDDSSSGSGEDDPPNTVVHVRSGREEKSDRQESADAKDEVRSVRGSTRLEAKRQRRRDGREAGRRRVPILSESEFLARRESVDRKMVVNERGDSVQIGVLEDGVLVEHFVTSAGSGSLVGNVYLGRVQNVLPSMEAAFVDIGRGRNAVLYAGEVDWDAAGLEGKARKIEQALSTGDSVLVQVTKDPVGHKGARLTTQISLPGRFLVYVPGGGATGISRKLPDTERKRLKDVLKRVVPEDAGVIIRTASEGVSEDELGRDVRRLRAQWEVIREKAAVPNTKAPQLLYEEPDLLIKVVRDLFTEDFSALTVQGDGAWDTIEAYVTHVAPDLVDRLKRHVSNTDVFTEYRIDEQILKALDRKVWLPSGGYLVIDRTEAMTVIDVNTGKFTGSGGNLEETVTRNNLEAAEEIVRQLRLRDIGGIIVVDFIDMVLESNRDLVLRRLTECLGRDRTRHQVAEVTSLGLVQMTRKRVGTGLLEAFSTTCEHCRGRGVVVSTTPVHSHAVPASGGNGGGGGNGGNGGHGSGHAPSGGQQQGGGRRRNRGGGQDADTDGQQRQEQPKADRGSHQEKAAPRETAQPEPVDTVTAPWPEPVVAEAPVSAPAVSAFPPAPEAAAPEWDHAFEEQEHVEPAPVVAGQAQVQRARRVERKRATRRQAAPEPGEAVTPVTPRQPAPPAVQSAHTNGHHPDSSEAAEAVAGAASAAVAGEHAADYAASRQPAPRPVRRRSASRPAGPPVEQAEGTVEAGQRGEQTPV